MIAIQLYASLCSSMKIRIQYFDVWQFEKILNFKLRSNKCVNMCPFKKHLKTKNIKNIIYFNYKLPIYYYCLKINFQQI